jgi:hypothetical protein
LNRSHLLKAAGAAALLPTIGASPYRSIGVLPAREIWTPESANIGAMMRELGYTQASDTARGITYLADGKMKAYVPPNRGRVITRAQAEAEGIKPSAPGCPIWSCGVTVTQSFVAEIDDVPGQSGGQTDDFIGKAN